MPAARDSKRIQFIKEIKQMMYGFGDVSAPREDTAEVVQNYLTDHLNILLINIHNMAKIKGKTKTEDLLYFLKRDRKKYARARLLLKTNDELKKARKIFEAKEYEKDV